MFTIQSTPRSPTCKHLYESTKTSSLLDVEVVVFVSFFIIIWLLCSLIQTQQFFFMSLLATMEAINFIFGLRHSLGLIKNFLVFVMSHIGQGRVFLALYMQRLLLTKQTRFKAVSALLGPKRTISTRLGVGRYKWYQSRSLTPVWGFVWLCLFDPAIPWDTTRTLCLHGGCL